MAIAGFPDATNTGLPAGVTLTASGGLVINTPGVVIQGLDIRGMVTINADNVTLQNCKITNGGWAVVNITSGSSGVVIKDCEINGLSAEGVRGISGQGTFLRNNIHHTEDGIYLTGSNTLIQDNYIHDLQSNWSGPHYDGIATDGGVSNIVIRHNTIINDHGQTSALMLSNYFGSVTNVTVDNNWLEGGGYTVYSDGQFNNGTISGVSFTNNYLVAGQYGVSSIRNNTPVWQGNIEVDLSDLTYNGTVNADTLITNFSGLVSEIFNGLGGNDRLDGGLGADVLNGGTGTDTAVYTSSNGAVSVSLANGAGIGGSANGDVLTSVESLLGSSFADKLIGSSGVNTLNGGLGGDTMYGLAGNDVYVVDNAGDIVNESVAGSTGVDTVQSSISFSLSNTSRVFGGVEYLTLLGSGAINGTGNTLSNVLTGNAGINVLNGGSGADNMRGGAGNDFYVVDNAGDIINESLSGSTGTDTVQSSISFSLSNTSRVFGGVEYLTLLGSGAINGTGNALNNVLTGNAGINVLNGGSGADNMRGGAGNDVYVVDNAGDIINESLSGSTGTDTVQSSISFSLSNTSRVFGGVEYLKLLGSGAINGTGNALNNVLTGNAGVNVLNGAAGNDILSGGGGKDTLTGSAGNDTFFFNSTLNATSNIDRITDFSAPVDTIRLENAVFTALATGTLSSAAFYAGAAAHDASDRIIYNQATGALTYDSNGNATGGAVQFATLGAGLALTNADFFVV